MEAFAASELALAQWEAYRAKAHHQYIWSLPFMVQRDLIVARNADPEFKLEQLRDERLGTVLGFSYPSLEPLLANGAIHTQHVLVALIKNGNERVPEQRGSQACSGPSGERQQQPMAQLPAD